MLFQFLIFEELDDFFNGKQIDLVYMKEDKYNNVSISGKVFDISAGLSIAVKQAIDEK